MAPMTNGMEMHRDSRLTAEDILSTMGADHVAIATGNRGAAMLSRGCLHPIPTDPAMPFSRPTT